MAQDDEPPKSVDKGKGKVVETDANKSKDIKKDKDGKPIVNGKAEEPVVGGRSDTSCLINTLAK